MLSRAVYDKWKLIAISDIFLHTFNTLIPVLFLPLHKIYFPETILTERQVAQVFSKEHCIRTYSQISTNKERRGDNRKHIILRKAIRTDTKDLRNVPLQRNNWLLEKNTSESVVPRNNAVKK